ncbi:MAG: hypothetical protein JW820_01775 [Spirochaetales bacterium]|nr:hypothetical protein [Spirochaetales bacterium]
MKRAIVLVLILAAGSGLAFANGQVRFGLDSAVGMAGDPSFAAVHEAYAAGSNVLHGLHWEVIHDHIGFGSHALVRFDQQPVAPEVDQWSMDWDADLFLSVHLAGVGRLFDPFVELGLGTAGRILLDDDADGTWVQDSEGLWHYETGDTPQGDGPQALSLYPYVAGGLALDLRGLLVGTRVCYRPWNEAVPATSYPVYPLTPVQVTLFGGVALGGHRGAWR